MKTKNNASGKEGAILAVILIVMVILSIVVMGLFNLGVHGARETGVELRNAQAFWLAEAGRQWCLDDLYKGLKGNGGETKGPRTISADVSGTFEVVKDGDAFRICTGTVTSGGQTLTRSVRIGVAFIASPFEDVLYAGNENSTNEWTLRLSGTGTKGAAPPVSGAGGADTILGDATVIGGNVLLEGDASTLKPDPNNYGVQGDVDASGSIVDLFNNIAGTATEGVSREALPSLSKMNYAANNDYDVAKIFSEAETAGLVNNGRLTSKHPLYGVLNVVKNPADRSTENASTVGDDYYFEPYSGIKTGTISTGATPLNLGDDKVYYVDGHVWFHNTSTYGFKVDGQAVIVASRDIHVSDNLQYANSTRDADADLLALVALGQYTGDVLNGFGNIYFGDPRYGTMYTVDAFMFANNNFYYNTDSITGAQQEPSSGFNVFGNFMAVNQIVLYRDWYQASLDTGTYKDGRYTKTAVLKDGKWYDSASGALVTVAVTANTTPRAAEKNVKGVWVDAITKKPLSEIEINKIKHYAMRAGYDDRIRDSATQMWGLPQGDGTIFAGETSWQEYNP